MFLVAASVTPLLVKKGEGKQQTHASGDTEIKYVLGLFLSLLASHTAAVTMGLPLKELNIMFTGVAGNMNKMLLIVLHLSERHFHSLNVADSIIWVIACTTSFRPHPASFAFLLILASSEVFFAFSLNMIARETLNGIMRERDRREQAEGAQKAFLSYIMHEMRNPLSGALLLTTEFQESLKELLLDSVGICAAPSSKPESSVEHSKESDMKGGGGTFTFTEKQGGEMKREKEEETGEVENKEETCESGAKKEGAINGETGKQSAATKGEVHGTLTSESPIQKIKDLSEVVSLLSCQLEKMQTVCNDVLQLSKLESGKFEYKFQQGDVFAWLRSIESVSGRTFFADSEELFRCNWETDAVTAARIGDGTVTFPSSSESDDMMINSAPPMRAVADFPRLGQVIDNFLSNARKFCPSREVSLRASVSALSHEREQWIREQLRRAVEVGGWDQTEEEEEEEGGTAVASSQRVWLATIKKLCTNEDGDSPRVCTHTDIQWAVLRVTVQDKGVGLRSEDFSRLFRPYSQIRAGELQNGMGTGLGLAICKGFVEAHGGGRIWAESEGPDKGSSFLFEVFLPLVPCPPRRQSRTSTGSSSLSRRGSADFFKSRRSPVGGTLGTLEEGGKPKSQTKVEEGDKKGGSQKEQLSLSEFTTKEESMHGVAGQLAGPSSTPFIRWNTLSPTSLRVPPDEHEGGEAGSHRRCVDVLLVDDDRFCLLAGSAVIRRLGLSVETAESGERALELVTKTEGLSYRLLICDNNMPGLKGFQTVSKIRDHFLALQQKEGGHSMVFPPPPLPA
uniref:histidine kinase n=1 Tax=Chromera velia CCMP2878 TaxID=1169474 RepID=A0A0G4IFG1_9ALVE|eukprot:Cvel_14029.t1-p1 / transcript=Cvel_14029.t1 / gene=Cvel_14029 / organism=Chromera_velia_CCMP2878 / gene_product=Ethylene receptor 2, putative / transcript_product=Ethylene receptor 2, putative / location=Cvel_scaffold982:55364-58518(-) / protein_length=792 / sequence_SO=supercontig / SO=protein_coding / is_pseudo=false